MHTYTYANKCTKWPEQRFKTRNHEETLVEMVIDNIVREHERKIASESQRPNSVSLDQSMSRQHACLLLLSKASMVNLTLTDFRAL